MGGGSDSSCVHCRGATALSDERGLTDLVEVYSHTPLPVLAEVWEGVSMLSMSISEDTRRGGILRAPQLPPTSSLVFLILTVVLDLLVVLDRHVGGVSSGVDVTCRVEARGDEVQAKTSCGRQDLETRHWRNLV